jgi:hypothetical protein
MILCAYLTFCLNQTDTSLVMVWDPTLLVRQNLGILFGAILFITAVISSHTLPSHTDVTKYRSTLVSAHNSAGRRVKTGCRTQRHYLQINSRLKLIYHQKRLLSSQRRCLIVLKAVLGVVLANKNLPTPPAAIELWSSEDFGLLPTILPLYVVSFSHGDNAEKEIVEILVSNQHWRHILVILRDSKTC